MSSTTSSLEWARQMSNHIEQLNQSNKFLGDRLEAQAETMAKVVSERNRLREALRDEIVALKVWRTVPLLNADVHEGIEISLSKLTTALNDQKGGVRGEG